MDRAALAERLISSKTRRDRERLLRQNPELADSGLARAIKDICYSAWTVNPTTAQRSADAIDLLNSFSPDKETDALRLWVRGISDITRGALESATLNLDAASRAFRLNGELHEAAKPLVAMLIALAMLGRYDQAVKTAKTAIRIFEKFGDDVEAGKIELNLSNVFSRQGLYRRAQKYGLAALRRFEKAGEMTWRTMAENDLANTYTDLNDFRSADRYYRRALASATRAGMVVTQAEIEASIGNLARFRGNYGDALRYLETSRGRYDGLSMRHQSAIADLEIAGIYSELNLLIEAAELYAKSAIVLRKLKMRGEEAAARANLGRTALALGNIRLAQRQLNKARELYTNERNKAGLASVLLTAATLDINSERFRSAGEKLSELRSVTRRGDRARLYGDILLARLEAASGDISRSVRRLQRVIAAARAIEQPAIEQNALDVLGQISESDGRLALAEECYRNAISIVETLRSPLPGEEFRIAYLAGKLEPYNNLAKLLVAKDRYAAAFECIEQSRARSLVDSMLESANPASGAVEFSETAQNLREELNWYYNRVARVNADEATKLNSEIRKREKRLTDVLRRIGSIELKHAAARGSAAEGSQLAALQRDLAATHAFIEYFEIDGKISAFGITRERIDHFAEIALSDEILSLIEGLRFQFDSLRYRPEAIARFQDLLKAKADQYLSKLYEKLIRPLDAAIGNRSLIIAPVSHLHYVPFNALRQGDRYLIEDRELVYVPSAAVWQTLAPAADLNLKRALLMSFADEQIPQADRETAALQRLFSEATILTGTNATFEAYRLEAPNYDVVHLACHGQFRPDDPAYSGLHLADGWITVKDVCSQRLRAGLVTLSACETGLNKIAKGEELIGLSRGFLTAGAKSIVLSLWTVDDLASVILMKDFYKNLQRGKTVSASLRSAQRNCIKKGKHPYFWSPFILIGR